MDRADQRRIKGYLLIGAALLGCVAGAALGWHLVPDAWQFSFWETFAVAGNAAKYGHPVEHEAEGIAIMVLCVSAIGALLSCGVTALIPRILRPAARLRY